MNPKNTAKRSLSSRNGIPNARRRAAMEPTPFARAHALNRRERSLLECGFFPMEATALAESIPVKGKHTSIVPGHGVVSKIQNEKPAFKESLLLKKWGPRLQAMERRKFITSLPEGMSLRNLTQLLVQTIRFFGRHYSPATAESIALRYLSGAKITSPVVPTEIQRLRGVSQSFYFKLDGVLDGRRAIAQELLQTRKKLQFRGFRIVRARSKK